MTQTSEVAGPETERRIRLTHHLLELDDGHEVGVSLGGRGVPLVFMHGLGLSRRAYLRMLSRVAGLGFLVIAIDAAGHGETLNLPRTAGELADRVDLTLRTLDALGIDRAVFAGHSMGGRMAIQVAALAPERVLATVLFDAAAGASFDEAVPTLLHSPRKAMQTVVGMVYDTQRDPLRLSMVEGGRYLRMLAAVALGNARHLGGCADAARAIMHSGDYTPLLHMMRDNDIPTIVLHGEKDLIVPFDSARDLAEDADATLYRVPGAYHSWMIANPRHGADALRQLLDGVLGEVLRTTAKALRIKDWHDAEAWDRALVDPESWIRELNGQRIEVLGADEPDHLEMDLVRCAQRPVPDAAPWVRRTYRRFVHRQPGVHRASRWLPADRADASTA
jgi:pimeloyl-ACP methyl ester carboxylesterase